jgi:hypothetical protein
MSTTKPWNVDLTTVPNDECVYVDYLNEDKKEPCSVKLKTSRTKDWIDIFSETYPDTNLAIDSAKQSVVIMRPRIKEMNATIKVYPTTGVILAQGSAKLLKELSVNTLPDIKNKLESRQKKKETEQEVENPESNRSDVSNIVDDKEISDETEETLDAGEEVNDTNKLVNASFEEAVGNIEKTLRRKKKEIMQRRSEESLHSPSKLIKHFEKTDSYISKLETAYEKVTEEISNLPHSIIAVIKEELPALVKEVVVDAVKVHLQDALSTAVKEFKETEMQKNQMISELQKKGAMADLTIDTLEKNTQKLERAITEQSRKEQEYIQRMECDHTKIIELEQELKNLTSVAHKVNPSDCSGSHGIPVVHRAKSDKPGIVTKNAKELKDQVTVEQAKTVVNVETVAEKETKVMELHNQFSVLEDGAGNKETVLSEGPKTYTNDSPSNNTEEVKSEVPFETARDKRAAKDPCQSQQQTEVIMCSDSIAQYIDARFFCRQKRSQIVRTGSAKATLERLQKWQKNQQVKYFIIQVGGNDLRNNEEPQKVADYIMQIHRITREKYPNSKVYYNECLFRDDVKMNKKINELNTIIKKMDEITYISHKKLQDMASRKKYYKDHIHINSHAGTPVLIANIHRVIFGNEQHTQNYTVNKVWTAAKQHNRSVRTPGPDAREPDAAAMLASVLIKFLNSQ